MKALVDLDGVLVDFVGGALCQHGIKTNPYDYPSNHGIWDFVPLLGMNPTDFWGALNYDFWARLGWMADGKEILKLVEFKYGRENVVLCTSPADTFGCVDGKKAWVREHLPVYRKQIVFCQAKELLAHKGAILIDDSDANIARFRAAGGQALLVPRLWNERHAFADRAARIVSLFLED